MRHYLRKDFRRQRINPDQFPPNVQAKWPARVLEEGFVPFPKRLLRCLPHIFRGKNGTTDLAALLAIVDFKRTNQLVNPSLAYLAFVAGLSEDTFRERLKHMEKRGLVEVTMDEDEEDVLVDLKGLASRVIELTTDEGTGGSGTPAADLPF